MAGAQTLTPAAGVVLVAHGSRDPAWRGPIEAVASRIAARSPATPVRCAYLELQEPGVATAAAELVAAGARRITLVPMFLGLGKHARTDLPRLVTQLQGAHPGTRFVLQPPVGEDPRLLDLMAEIALG